LLSLETKPWVRDVFLEKFGRTLGQGYMGYRIWDLADPAEFERQLSILRRLPKDSPLLAQQREIVADSAGHFRRLSDAQREQLWQVLGLPPPEANQSQENAMPIPDGD
jgi:hypothetical protein